jgi:hypothetical protein
MTTIAIQRGGGLVLARRIPAGSYLTRTATPITGYPFTLVARFLPASTACTGVIVGLDQPFSGSAKVNAGLYVRGDRTDFAGDPVLADIRDYTSGTKARIGGSTNAFRVGQWNAAIAEFTSGNATIWLNGGAAGTNNILSTGSTPSVSGLTEINFLRSTYVSSVEYGNETVLVADVAVFSRVLTERERAYFMAGGSAANLRPVAHWWGKGHDRDLIGGYDLTPSGLTDKDWSNAFVAPAEDDVIEVADEDPEPTTGGGGDNAIFFGCNFRRSHSILVPDMRLIHPRKKLIVPGLSL